MRRSLLETLCCPEDRGALSLDPGAVGNAQVIKTGTLTCAVCRQAFTIIDGIASLLPRILRIGAGAAVRPGEAAALDAMQREMALRDEEGNLYDALYDDASYRFEIETYLGALAARPTEYVLDVGCGTGRITKEFAAQTAGVVGADFSLESLRYFRSRLGGEVNSRVDLVQCEVGHLPFRDACFDAAVATSLFSNVPTAATRNAGLEELDRVLRPHARLLVTVYNHAWLKRVRHRLGLSRSGQKQGVHSGGRVVYYNFEPQEFRAWIETRFDAGPIFGLNHRVPVLSKLSASLAVGLDRRLAALPGSLRICAKEMGMVARKR